jgi:putative integral membrane protein (TIGR02587 family)
MLATFLLLLAYNRYGGLRRDATMTEVAIDSVEEMGIGIVLSAVALFLLGRITLSMPIDEMAGQVVIEAMTVAIGVSVGTAQLGASNDDEGFEGKSGGKSGGRAGQKDIQLGGQIVLAFCGATLFAANVAPTEEIVMIAIEISWVRLVGLALASLLLCALILHFSEFTGAREFVRTDGFAAVVLATFITYAVALVASALILWYFGRFDGVTLYTALAQTVVLGVAASLGASAGRLLLQ